MRLPKLATAASLLVMVGSARASETISYSYDAQGRLITSVHNGTVNNGTQSNYTFDDADNRTNVTIVGGPSRVVVVPISGLEQNLTR